VPIARLAAAVAKLTEKEFAEAQDWNEKREKAPR
jgi:hypothetical protein